MFNDPQAKEEWERFVREVKERAEFQWAHILKALGIPPHFIDRRANGPCPVCTPASRKNSDRFRFYAETPNGHYYCRNSSHGPGDGITLLMGWHGWSFGHAIKEVNDHLGGVAFKEHWAKVRQGPVDCGPYPDEESAEKLEKRLRWVRRTLWSAKPAHKGDLVDRYLRQRGIELDSFPCSLRYHPALEYTELVDRPGGEVEYVKLGTFPAMLAEVTDKDGNLLTVHRTYLDPDLNPETKGKARIFSSVTGEMLDAKKVMSSSHGGIIRLSPVPEHGILGISEGIETAFGAHFLLRGRGYDAPVWPALNAPGFKSVPIPSDVHTVLIFADNDPEDQYGRRAGQEAATELAERLRAEGRTVKVYLPPKEGMDWLDVYLEHQQGKAMKDAA